MRDEIFNELRADIIEGRIEPGTQLKEVPLAKRFEVSRTPIRDVLSRLEESGLAVRNNRGLEVRGLDPEAVIQVYDLRILLEEEVAGQAALNRSLSDILTLEALLERDRNLDNPSDRELIETNLEFHTAIWNAAANPVLVDVLERLSSHLVHAPTSTLSVGSRLSEALDQHEALIKAIDARDAETARSIARQHFTEAREIRLGLLRTAAVEEATRRR